MKTLLYGISNLMMKEIGHYSKYQPCVLNDVFHASTPKKPSIFAQFACYVFISKIHQKGFTNHISLKSFLPLKVYVAFSYSCFFLFSVICNTYFMEGLHDPWPAYYCWINGVYRTFLEFSSYYYFC